MNLSFNQYAKDRGEYFPIDEEKRLGLLACLFHRLDEILCVIRGKYGINVSESGTIQRLNPMQEKQGVQNPMPLHSPFS
jgi:hypothetical protein